MAKHCKVNENCIGCGLCEGICSEVFEVVDGAAHCKFDEVPADLEAGVEEAAGSCPAGAIEVE